MNILVTYPSINELNSVPDITPNDSLNAEKINNLKQTYKCIFVLAGIEKKTEKFEKNRNPIELNKVIVIHDQDYEIDLIKSNIKKAIEIAYSNSDASKDIYIDVQKVSDINNFKDNFSILEKMLKDSPNDIFYFNLGSGLKETKKYLYPIGIYNDNARIIEAKSEMKKNKAAKNSDDYRKNYEKEFLNACDANSIESFNIAYNEFIEDVKKNTKSKEMINKKSFESIDDVRSIIFDRAKKVDSSDYSEYFLLNKYSSLKENVKKFNYYYLLNELLKLEDKENLEIFKTASKLYSASLNEYDLKESYYDAYLTFAVLIAQNKNFSAIYEIDNVFSKELLEYTNFSLNGLDYFKIIDNASRCDTLFYKIMESGLAKLRKNSNKSLDNILLDEINKIEEYSMPKEIFKKVSKEGSINITDNDYFKRLLRLLGRHNEVNYSGFDIDLNAKTNKDIIDNCIKGQNKAEKIKKLYNNNKNNISDVERLFAFITCINEKCKNNNKLWYIPKNSILNKIIEIINIVKAYQKLFIFSDSKYKGESYTRNFYYNILNDIDSKESIEYRNILSKSMANTNEEISEVFGSLDNINSVIINNIMDLTENQVNKFKSKIRSLQKRIKFLITVRNSYAHNGTKYNNVYDQLMNRRNIDEYLEDISKISEDPMKVKEVKRALENKNYRINSYLNDVLNDFFSGYMSIDDYNESLIQSLNYLTLENDSVSINDNKEETKALVSIFTEKNPCFQGIYSPALSILLHEKNVEHSEITDVYFLVSYSYRENYVFNKEKVDKIEIATREIYPNIKIHYYSFDKNANEININNLDNDFGCETLYDVDMNFKNIINIYNKILRKHKKILIDETSGMPQMVVGLMLLKNMHIDNIDSFKCVDDSKIYYEMEKDDKYNPGNGPETTRTYPLKQLEFNKDKDTLPFFEIRNEKSAFKFVNIIDAQRNAINENYDFNFLYNCRKYNKTLSYEGLKSIENMYKLFNGLYDIDDDKDKSLLYMTANSKYMIKGGNLIGFTLSSGAMVESIIRTIYKRLNLGYKLELDIQYGEEIKVSDTNYNIKFENRVNSAIIDINSKKYKLISGNILVLNKPKIENKKQINLLSKDIWLPLIYSYKNSDLSIEKMITLYELYDARNSLIHKIQFLSDDNYSDDYYNDIAIEGFNIISDYISNSEYSGDYNNLLEEYETNIELIRKELNK